MNIAEQLRKRLIESHIPVEDIASRSRISRATLFAFKRAQTISLTLANAEALAEALGAKLDISDSADESAAESRTADPISTKIGYTNRNGLRVTSVRLTGQPSTQARPSKLYQMLCTKCNHHTTVAGKNIWSIRCSNCRG